MSSERQQSEQSQQLEQQRALRRKILGERAILKRARAMTGTAFDAWKKRVRLVQRVSRFQRKREARERKRLLWAWRVVAMRERKEREERRRLVRTAFRAWLARVRARNRRGSDDDDAEEEADNGKKEERRREKEEEEDCEKEKEKERNSLLARRMFHRWHASALTRRRNEREKEFIKLEVREKFIAAKARETKARWKSEARRTRACQYALETLRIAAVKDLEGEKENACERNNSKEDDEKFSHKRRERLREALMKQKARLLEEIEREENRERIRARFGN
jgi:hypothetical protein